MRIPTIPPSMESIIGDEGADIEKITRLIDYAKQTQSSRAYLHWDQFKRRPAPDNLSHAEAWLGIKMGRNSNRQILPFHDSNTQPFHMNRPEQMLADLRQIDLRAGGTIDTGQAVTNPSLAKQRLRRSIMEEPFSSSVLEGAATTRVRAKAMIEEDKQPETIDDRMVINNYRAMAFIKTQIDTDLTPELILEVHRIISEGTLDRPEMVGALRDTDDVVVEDERHEILHIPPTFTELPDRLENLCTFANQSEADTGFFLHPIVQAIIVHYVLAYDHPFVDGNGRTARALFYWSVLRSGYWIFEYVSISKIIKEAPAKYGRAFLHAQTDENDLTYFVLHQLQVLLKSIEDLEIYLDRQKQKFDAFVKLTAGRQFNYRQTSVLNELVRNRISEMTIKQHEKLHGVSYLTARKDLEELMEQRLLTKRQSGRQSIYRLHKRAAEQLQIQKP